MYRVGKEETKDCCMSCATTFDRDTWGFPYSTDNPLLWFMFKMRNHPTLKIDSLIEDWYKDPIWYTMVPQFFKGTLEMCQDFCENIHGFWYRDPIWYTIVPQFFKGTLEICSDFLV